MIALLPGGVQLAYDEAGAGTPVVFIHGWPHNRSIWAAQLRGLMGQARSFAVDLRGFGDSTVAPPWSIDAFADDVAAFLGVMGVERAVICGLSMGGYTALSLLRNHPQVVRALVLASTRAAADTPEARAKRMRLIDFVRERGVEALASKQLRAMVGETTVNSRRGVLEGLRVLMASAPEEGVVGALAAMAERPDATGMLPGIECPVMVVSGAEDTFTTPDELARLAAAIPCARLEVIQGAGHVCAFERPAAFNHVMAEFLASLVYH